LLDFVPDAYKHDDVPCHFIPLNEAGDTVASLSLAGDQDRLEEEVANWLRITLVQLRAEVESDEQ
jgi:hypothetical protein